ncbi:copper resistance protein NlpE N-terminal domain-containing protein [Thermomonas sp.]|uniref:copper resistance protein NlpE N-terminal domain-containing protein n=1 Tax=Thermomonas sp. TaxID=1971895 RepID=UPI0035B12D03
MPRPLLSLLLCLSLLAGCDAPAPAGGRASPAIEPALVENTLEFRGQRPCVDCAGIDAWLRLQSGAGLQRYQLVERYRSNGRDLRFEDAGDWIAQGDLLRLQSAQGGTRTYLRQDDGSLQARGIDGASLPALADDVLLPTSFDGDR